MSEIKHITILNELPIGTKFETDITSDVFEVVKVGVNPPYKNGSKCFYCDLLEYDGWKVPQGYFEECESVFCCCGWFRGDKTDVVFKKVKEE